MAQLINPEGKIISILPDPDIGYITMKTIYGFLKSIVEPIFIDTKWMFVCKKGKKLNYKLNDTASKIAGYDIYGDVIIADDFELSKTFFIPEDLKEEIIRSIDNLQKQYLKNQKNEILQQKQMKEGKSIENEEKNEFIDHLTEKQINEEIIMRNTYNSLFNIDLSFKKIMKDFSIYIEETDEVFLIDNVFEDRFKILNKLLDYYIGLEEYEKCINIKKFIEKMKKFYKIN